MDFEALGNIGDFIGGVGVVLTLFYLAIQIRQNTRAVKASSWHDIVASARAVNQLRANPESMRIWANGLRHFPDLPTQDLIIFSSIIADESLHFQQVVALHAAGQLDDSTYDAFARWIGSIVATPGGRAWWESAREVMVPMAAEAIDRRAGGDDLHDLLAFTESYHDCAPSPFSETR